MEHDLDAFARPATVLRVPDVPLVEVEPPPALLPDPPPDIREVGLLARGEVVEHPHLVAPLEQGRDEVRADEPRAAGDEDTGHAARSATTW